MRGKTKTLLVAGFVVMLSGLAFAAKVDPQDAKRQLALHYFRGVINYESGSYQEAADEFRAVAAVDPYYKDTQGFMKKLDQHRSEFLAPEDDGRKFEGKGTDLYFLGKHYYERGDYAKAAEAFDAILDKNKNDKLALYYKQLIEARSPKVKKGAKVSPKNKKQEILNLEQEVSYIKEDVEDRQEDESFLQEKARARAERDEILRKKQRELEKQEEIIDEERKDYLEEARISRRGEKLAKEGEKWRRKREKLTSRQPGTPADLTQFPVYVGNGEKYFRNMKEALQQSRWNTAGLNAIQASLNYCDSILIYYYGIKSGYPEHENISRLMAENIQREDLDENLTRLRAILNMKTVMEEEDRPLTRSEAIFLSEKTEQLIQWCRSILP